MPALRSGTVGMSHELRLHNAGLRPGADLAHWSCNGGVMKSVALHIVQATDTRPSGLSRGPHPYQHGPLVLGLTALAWLLVAAVLYGFWMVIP